MSKIILCILGSCRFFPEYSEEDRKIKKVVDRINAGKHPDLSFDPKECTDQIWHQSFHMIKDHSVICTPPSQDEDDQKCAHY